MKKLSLILSGALLLGGISFAAPVVKQAAKAPIAQQKVKPAKGTKSTKAPVKKAPAKKTPAKKAAAATPAAK
jgi:hypothetical protein